MKRLLLLILVVTVSSRSGAQSHWLQRTQEGFVAIEYLSPNFKAEASFFKISGYALILSGRIPLSENLYLIAQLPYASTTVEVSFFGPTVKNTESSIANPYAGVEFCSPDVSFFANIGISAPLLPDNKSAAVLAPSVGDFTHLARYIPSHLAVLTDFNYQPVSESGLAFLLGISPAVFIPTEGGGAETEIIAGYSGGIGLIRDVLHVGATVTGQWFITGEEPFSEDSFRHHFQIDLNGQLGPVRPGGYFRIPIGSSLSDIVSNSFGVFVAITL